MRWQLSSTNRLTCAPVTGHRPSSTGPSRTIRLSAPSPSRYSPAGSRTQAFSAGTVELTPSAPRAYRATRRTERSSDFGAGARTDRLSPPEPDRRTLTRTRKEGRDGDCEADTSRPRERQEGAGGGEEADDRFAAEEHSARPPGAGQAWPRARRRGRARAGGPQPAAALRDRE